MPFFEIAGLKEKSGERNTAYVIENNQFNEVHFHVRNE